MVGPSKILTVSYGTFSCTLEGFDDPFSTMKAIAEYFRDLAADDRYFGAEPPQPDAEMLGRIAEKEIQRRVEAKVGATGIVLRQTEGTASGDTAAAMASAAPASAVVPAVVPAAAAAPAPAVVAGPGPAEESVAAKLMRIRAAVAAARATPPVQIAAQPIEDASGEDYDVEDDAPAAEIAAFADATPVVAASDEGTAPEPAVAPVDAAPAAEVPVADIVAPATPGMTEAVDGASTAEVAAEGDAASAPATASMPARAETTDADERTAAMSPDDATVAEEIAAVSPADAEPLTASEPASETVPDPQAEAAFDISAVLSQVGEPAAESDAASSALADAEHAVEAAGGEADTAFDDAEDDAEDSRSMLSRLAARAAAESGLSEGWIDPTSVVEAEAAAPAEPAPEAVAVPAGPALSDTTDPFGGDVDSAVTHHIADEAEASADTADILGAVAGAVEEGGDTLDDAPAIPVEHANAAETSEEDLLAALRDAGVEAAAAEEPGIDLEQPLDAQDTDGVTADEATTPALPSAPADAPVAEAAAEPTAPTGLIGRARARVIKVRRSVTDTLAGAPLVLGDAEKAATEEPALPVDRIGDAARADAPQSQSDDGRLPDADEADLLRQLAEAAAETADRRDPHEGREILAGAAADDDAAVERLMEEANTKLDGPESRRRLSAIAHLKAAVAATVADRKLKRTDPVTELRPADEDMEDRFRDDLSKAVRPRRPAAEGATATRRPQIESRPAPLVLVSELRVDRPMSETIRDAAVVRPRRISAGNLALSEADDDLDTEVEAPLSPDEAKNFAEFAERVGAASLPDLLEAAAVYTATVEGIPHFSRPHVLRKVASAQDEGGFNREDGLRSFGLLLRQGKIQKVRRGQFSVTESSRFMSEARSATR
jgi:hypothetical protein